MGRLTARHLHAASGLELVGGFAREVSPANSPEPAGLVLYDDLTDLYDRARPEVVVDFTTYPATLDVAREAVVRGISPVIGATGWTPEDEIVLGALCDRHGVGAALVPNFAIGTVLAMRFAVAAAPFFPTVEIVEMHHDAKRDAPSGTAKLTAQRIAAASAHRDVVVHSVRLRGLVAHQAVMFGGEGEVLTIRADSLSRESFMPGVELVARAIRSRAELVIGLDSFLEAR